MADLMTIWNQISTGTKMACGAREAVAADGYLHFRVGSARQFKKIVIRLEPTDTYSVELVDINRRTFETKVETEQTMVYADSLSTVIYGMCNR